MINIKLSYTPVVDFLRHYSQLLVIVLLSIISAAYFTVFFTSGLSLAYNDARSHLDIGRRVVEGLKPGLAQLGSVWLPLTHLLMAPTIWNDFMWHSGLAGSIQSMVAFVATGFIIYKFLEKLQVGLFGRWVGVAIFVANLNVLYLQSTAMTELPLLATMTVGCYYLLVWHKDEQILDLIKAAFWIMLSTLIRYDGWFLIAVSALLVFWHALRKRGFKVAEGTAILFCTLSGFGIFLWLLWNQLIFKDALYFALGPFSAHAQQAQLAEAGNLITKQNIWLSIKVYFYALLYNSYTFPSLLAVIGAVVLWCDKKLSSGLRLATTALLAPLAFNILALFTGFSVLFVQGISGNTWFNVRYGVMLLPSIAIFIGYLVDRVRSLRWVIVGLLAFVLFFAFTSADAVTVDDARVGSSQKNVSEVAGYLQQHAANSTDLILISAASHDAIIFSSGLPMKRFIHEGTGAYWDAATTNPDHWVRWIVMRTHDTNDLTWKFVSPTPGFAYYQLVDHYPFADVYELKPEYLDNLQPVKFTGKEKNSTIFR